MALPLCSQWICHKTTLERKMNKVSKGRQPFPVTESLCKRTTGVFWSLLSLPQKPIFIISVLCYWDCQASTTPTICGHPILSDTVCAFQTLNHVLAIYTHTTSYMVTQKFLMIRSYNYLLNYLVILLQAKSLSHVYCILLPTIELKKH